MESKKILITGVTGFVGSYLLKNLENTIPCPSLKGLNKNQIKEIIDKSQADIIIHTAAVSDIGDCEKDKDGSYYANVLIPTYIASAAKDKKLVFFSSDQVYSGLDTDGPYTEEYVCGANTYAKQKIEMEKRVLDINPDTVLLRAEWMYDYISYKGNYYLNLLNAKDSFKASSKQYRGVTYVKEVCENIIRTFSMPGGAYNFGSETTKSIYDISVEFSKHLNLNVQITDTTPGHNLWMDCSKGREYGINFSDVSNGLIRCAKDHKDNL